MFNLDANHAELVLAAQQLGILVIDNAMVKRNELGQLDVWFGITHPVTGLGVWVWVEIKMPQGDVRPSQADNIIECHTRGLPAIVIRNVDDLMKLFKRYTKG